MLKKVVVGLGVFFFAALVYAGVSNLGQSKGPTQYPIFQGYVYEEDTMNPVADCRVRAYNYTGTPVTYSDSLGHYVIYSTTRQAGTYCVDALKGTKKDHQSVYYNGSTPASQNFFISGLQTLCDTL
jgi:hypothetical protein